MDKWYLGAMNDGLFIINKEPRPSTDDAWHGRPDGPDVVLNVTTMTIERAQAIVDAHNAQPTTCTCIEVVDTHLAKSNTKLSRALVFSKVGEPARDPEMPLMLQTEPISRKRGARATTMFPSYCPFCGRHYNNG